MKILEIRGIKDLQSTRIFKKQLSILKNQLKVSDRIIRIQLKISDVQKNLKDLGSSEST